VFSPFTVTQIQSFINHIVKAQDRIISTIPVAQSSKKYSVEAFSSGSGKGLTLIMNAGPYPNEGGKAQSLKLTMICATPTQQPKITGYDGSQVTAEWSVVEACGVQKSGDLPKGGDGSNEDVGGSSMGWFFFVWVHSFTPIAILLRILYY
jgi:hypothetical protein